MKSKGASEKNFSWIPNGYCCNELAAAEPLSEPIAGAVPQSKFVVGYCGTLGTANAINVMLDAAKSTLGDSSIAYVLVGDGNLKEKIAALINDHNLWNVTLINSIPKKQVPSMLSLFDICYVGFNKSQLYRYGNSLNKLAEYFMSRRPIIFSIDSPFRPVDDANAGITVGAEDVDGIVAAIYKLKSMSDAERKQLGENGAKHAEEHYEFSKLAAKLSNIL